jgi:sulfide:quinone oxidoreductase
VAAVPEPHVVMVGTMRLEVERIVTAPRITGPAIPGLPAGPGGFIAVDGHCRVAGGGGRVFGVV